jgi:exopolysaccharide production protein ExoQ
MLQKSYQQNSDLFLILCLFFMSNISAFLLIVWLIPQFVFVELIIWFLLVTFAIWILDKNKLIHKFGESFKRNWMIFPFLLFSGFSILWSIDQEVSLYRWLILVFTVIAGGYIGLRHDLRKIIELLSVFGIYILLLSFILVVFRPDIGIMNYYSIQGAWMGLYWHKNHMGLIATFINILFLINLIDSGQSKNKRLLFWPPLYLLSLVFVYQSDSVAALITTIFLHCAIFLVLLLLKFGKYLNIYHYVILAIVLILAFVFLYFNIDYFFEMFNRNSSLTGRIPMWSYLFKTYFSQRPFLGYGFNAFWFIDSYRVAMGQAAGYPDPIVIADNGFIDILINTGYIGFSLFLIFYLGVWWRAIQSAIKDKDIIGLFPLVTMTYILLANISWSLIFESEGFFMLLMVIIMFFPRDLNE